MKSQSEVSSVVSEESKSASKNKDSKPNGLSKKNPTPKQSSEKDSPEPLFMTMLPKLILEQFQKLTSSPEDSHAKTSQSQENKLELRGVALHSGNITPKQLGFYDQSSHSLKTSQHLLFGDSMLSLVTLPKSGMMRNGIIYQLPQLVRFIKGKEFSSLHTPTSTGNQMSPSMRERDKGSWMRFPTPMTKDKKGEGKMRFDIRNFPTPVASDATTGAIIGKNDKFKILESGAMRKINQNGTDGSIGLARFAKFFPTPNSSDHRNRGNPEDPCIQRRINMGKQVGLTMTVSRELNPNWVEWLMGFPIGWTELNASETP